MLKAMVDAEENMQNKGTITEEDVCTLLQRYSATTVLALFKEVAQCVDAKIDWEELVKKTETGIKSAREYQMLWRHLAYRQPLIENIGPEDQPLDDDSDLEYEVEAYPPVSTADALEASNCVKVLTSGSANKSRMANNSNFEVPKIPSNPQVQKRSQAAGTFGERLDSHGPTSNNQKKRKQCPEEEVQEVIATAKKAEFKGEKNTTQRTQKANNIRKKQGSSNIGGANTGGSQLSEAQMAATRYALGMALKDGPSTSCGTGNGHAGSNNAVKIAASKRNLPVTKVTVPPSQPQPSPVSSVKPALMGSSSKLCPQRKVPPQSSVGPDSIQAAAVAAGARIASPSDAASLLLAAQSKNAVHIRGGSSLVKASAPGSSNHLPPNVHLICTGLPAKSNSVAAGTASYGAGGQAAKGSAMGPSVSLVSQLPKVRATSSVTIQGSDAKLMSSIPEEEAFYPHGLSRAALDNSRATSSGVDVGLSKQGDSRSTMNKHVTEAGSKDDNCKQATDKLVSNNDNVQRNTIPCVNGTHQVSLTAVVIGEAGKTEVSSEGLAK